MKKFRWQARVKSVEDTAFDGFNAMERYISGMVESTTPSIIETADAADRYSFIPFRADQFIHGLRYVLGLLYNRLEFRPGEWASRRPKFVDAGCGIGTKVVLAGQLGFDAYGVDIVHEYVEMAKHFAGNSKVFEGDITEHDYSPYDVIYFYCPISNVEGESLFEQRVAKTAKVGSYLLVCSFNRRDEWWQEMSFIRLGVNSREIDPETRANMRIFKKVGR